MARAVELDCEHRLPATHDQPPFFDEQRQKAGEEQLAAVRVAVHRFVDRDLEAAREVVVLIAGVARREALEQMLEITKQQRLVLYTDAYVWSAMTFTKPMGICGGVTGYWKDPPA